MLGDIESVLLSEQQLDEKVTEIAAQISRDYQDKDPVFIGVLKGSFVFMADLMRKIHIYCNIDFMAVSSYGDQSTSTGAVKISKDLERDIEGRHVIVVEDILDSGLTLSYLLSYLQGRKPASIKPVSYTHLSARR